VFSNTNYIRPLGAVALSQIPRRLGHSRIKVHVYFFTAGARAADMNKGENSMTAAAESLVNSFVWAD